MEQIENFIILEVGRAKNLTNNIYGDYKVLYRTKGPDGDNKAYWLCQCQLCNKYIIKPGSTLIHGVNECECHNDLTGKIFGRWTVMYQTKERTKNRTIIWHCKCECGNEKDVDAYTLKSGQSKSCGCLQKELLIKNGGQNKIDLTGQRFGKLVALYGIYGNSNNHSEWHCKCDCGNECDIDTGNLRQGFTQSCGCTHSKEEENIIKLLTKNNISFKYQYRFDNFKEKEYDFYIDNKYIIEYDGSQHFKCTNSGWDTQEHLDRTRKSDLEKNKYCFENNIPIIRIPYNKEYNINDLILKTTRYLLTPDNESEYYGVK